MSSLILRTTAKPLEPLLLLFSGYLLLEGHDEPGGGFSGGLTAAAAVMLRTFSDGAASARRLLRAEPPTLLTTGLFAALGAALLPVAFDRPLLTALWARLPLPGLGPVELGTPLLFDLGVYLVVLGATSTALLALEEE